MKLSQLFIFAVLIFWSPLTMAQTISAVDLDGFAWSETIGWISLNCRNDNNCTTTDYKVTINADRSITGWGWSSNIGWIKFGGLSNFPNGGGTVAQNARVTGTHPNLTWTGWARACAGTLNGNCDSMSNSLVAGGWDGWISLQGTNHSVSANMTTGMNNNSYAWGSDVVGWIDMFSHVSFVTASATIWGSGCTVVQGANSCSASLNWNINSSISTPNVYRVTAPASQLSTNRTSTNFGVNLTLGSNIFHARDNTSMLDAVTLNATCAPGLAVSGGVCQPTATTTPAINLRAFPPIVRRGNATTINWTLSTLTGSTCTLNGPGLANVAINTLSGTMTTGPILNAVNIRMTCSGAYGTVEEKVLVEVIPLAPEV